MEAITSLITGAVNSFLSSLAEEAASTFAQFMGNEMALAARILESTYVASAITLSQVLGGTLLGLKVSAEAVRSYVLHLAGEPGSDPGGLLKRTAYAAGAIGAGPWLAKNVYMWGAGLADSVARLPAGSAAASHPLEAVVGLAAMPFLLAVTTIAAVVIWVLILLQVTIRSVEIAVLAAVAPVMATGLTRPDEGVGAVWWRELLVLSTSQAVQIFLIKGLLYTIMTITFSSEVLKPLLLVAWLWVAFRTPAVLRQFAYHTGVAAAIGHTAQTAGTWYIMRRMFTRV